MNTMLHITTEKAWEDAQNQGTYAPPSLETEGFIHNSTRDEIINVAHRYYKGQKNLILLQIDIDRVAHEIRWEDPGNGVEYPHIYGPLNLDAVIATYLFEPKADGTFVLPEPLRRD